MCDIFQVFPDQDHDPVVVVVVVTRHGGAATFAEAVFKLKPQDTATDQGRSGLIRIGNSPGKVAEAKEA